MQRLLRSIAFTVLSISAIASWADADQVVHEARTVKYSSKDIVRISTRPRFTTLILLPANERILDFVIGDKDAWVLEGTQNFAYLKPSKPGLETSMDLITAAGNIYTFYCVSADTGQPDLKLFVEPSDEKLLSAASGPPRLVPASEVDQFQQAAQLQVKAAEEQTNRFRADYAVHTLRFDYRFKKNKKPFKLKTIYHDDKFTYIQCSAREKPAFYEIKDGQSTLVNFTLEDGVYVIDHVVDKGYRQAQDQLRKTRRLYLMSSTPQIPQAPETTAAAPVSDKRTPATGVIPKQMQSWIFLSVILVAAVGLWFSTSAKPKTNSGSASAAPDQAKPSVGGLSPDEVQRRLQEIEDARRRALKDAPPNRPGQSTNPSAPDANTEATPPGANAPPQSNPPVGDPIADDERKREYLSRFASNVALSYRTDSRPATSAMPDVTATSGASGHPEQTAITPAGELPGLSVDLQRQIELLQVQQEKLLSEQQQLATAATSPVELPRQQLPPVPAVPSSPSSSASGPHNADLNAATGKNHVLFEGTVLEAVLVNRLNSDLAGPVICQTSNDVYSHDRSQLLIPAGTRLLGEAKKVSEPGQERLAVFFHRLIMPDGYSVNLDQAPGLNQIGETALHDKVNNHYFKIFGASIAIGAIAGLTTIGTNNSAVTGLPTSNASAYREGVAESLSQSSLHILDKFLNIPPTITIREGHRVRIFLTQDLLLPAYSNHRMPSDL